MTDDKELVWDRLKNGVWRTPDITWYDVSAKYDPEYIKAMMESTMKAGHYRLDQLADQLGIIDK